MGADGTPRLASIGLAALLSLVRLDTDVGAATDGAHTNAAWVCAYDSVSGRPVGGVQVRLRRPGWYWSENHHEPEWFAFTDSSGTAHLESIPGGEYEIGLCHDAYRGREVRIRLAGGITDTLSVRLLQVGRPYDGRRCETIFILDASRRQEILERWRHGLEAADTVATTVAKPKRGS